MLANFHTHSTFSDGKNTPEELINYAIEKGFCSLGFSAGGFSAGLPPCCSGKNLNRFLTTINIINLR